MDYAIYLEFSDSFTLQEEMQMELKLHHESLKYLIQNVFFPTNQSDGYYCGFISCFSATDGSNVHAETWPVISATKGKNITTPRRISEGTGFHTFRPMAGSGPEG